MVRAINLSTGRFHAQALKRSDRNADNSQEPTWTSRTHAGNPETSGNGRVGAYQALSDSHDYLFSRADWYLCSRLVKPESKFSREPPRAPEASESSGMGDRRSRSLAGMHGGGEVRRLKPGAAAIPPFPPRLAPASSRELKAGRSARGS